VAKLTIQSELGRVADSFRLGREAEANQALARVIDRLQAELGADPRALAPVFPTLEAVMLGQQRGDLLFVADLLEYELAKMLVES